MSFISSLFLPHWLKMADWDVWAGSELLSFLATTHLSAAEDIKHEGKHVLRVGYLPGAVAANHCPSPAAIIWESAGLPRRGTEVITVWLRLLFGSIVWRRSSRAGILELKAQSSFREPLDAPVGNFRTNQTKLNRNEPRSSQWGGGTSIFFPYLLLILLICSNPDSMHPKTQSIFSPAASAPFMGDWKSCRARRTILWYCCLDIFHRPASPQTQNRINVQSY